jgi:hypothetical protein
MRRPLEVMSKKDIIETILFLLEQILSYSSKLNQSTTSIFDKKEKPEKNVESEISTDFSDSAADKKKEKNEKIESQSPILDTEKFSLSDLIYFWSDALKFDENLLILMTMNLDKILNSNLIILSEKNVENVIFTLMVITQKFHEDIIFTDKDYSKLKKIECGDLINMQVELLDLIDYSLSVTEDEFKRYKNKMRRLCEKNFLYLMNS